MLKNDPMPAPPAFTRAQAAFRTLTADPVQTKMYVDAILDYAGVQLDSGLSTYWLLRAMSGVGQCVDVTPAPPIQKTCNLVTNVGMRGDFALLRILVRISRGEPLESIRW